MPTEAELPDSCYAYVPAGEPPSARKLRLCSTDTGKLDSGIIGAAAAAIGPGFRGNRVSLPSSAVGPAKAKIRSAWKRVHPDSDPEDMPAAIRASELVRPLLFTTEQQWISFLPRPGTYQHALYGEIDLSPDVIDRIVGNFRAGVYGQDLPINAEHDQQASGAVGWITDMRVAADGSIEVQPAWNARGQALLDGDRFRYVSAEWIPEWQDPVSGEWHADVACGLAICTRPHFKTDVLRPLAASEAEAFAMANERNRPLRWTEEEQPADDEETTEEEETVIDVTEPVEAPAPEEEPMPEEGSKATEDEADAVAVDLTEQTVYHYNEMKRQLAEATKQLADRDAALAIERKEKRTKQFTDEVRGRSDENDTPWFGAIEDHVQLLLDLAEKFGEKSPQLRQYTNTNRAAAAAIQQSNLFKEFGTGRSKDARTPQEQADLLAKRLREVSPGMSKEQALSRVYADNPELYEEMVNG